MFYYNNCTLNNHIISTAHFSSWILATPNCQLSALINENGSGWAVRKCGGSKGLECASNDATYRAFTNTFAYLALRFTKKIDVTRVFLIACAFNRTQQSKRTIRFALYFVYVIDVQGVERKNWTQGAICCSTKQSFVVISLINIARYSVTSIVYVILRASVCWIVILIS